jgi:hypothetical protein
MIVSYVGPSEAKNGVTLFTEYDFVVVVNFRSNQSDLFLNHLYL